ncbi:MAG: NFACT RNA binding domain-containing protein, partial [Byssovorax sp.]
GSPRDPSKVVVSRTYRIFRGQSGAKILAGKGAVGNDALTHRVARPHDLWLHAKGRTGTHVIVQLEKNQQCPSELLVEAAHVAAHFSEGREEGVIEIQYTPRRYLRKPKGAAAGLVVVEREKVLVLRVDPAVTARLLAGEELG